MSVISFSDSARDWRASKTFVEMIDSFANPVHALESVAAKLDEMLPHYAPPVAPEPVKMVNYFDTLLPPVDMGGPRPVPRHLFGEGGMIANMPCAFPRCGCRGNCAAKDGPVPDGVFRPAPKTAPAPARWSDDGRLYEAARALYGAGCWSASNLTLVEQDKLWAALRDALGLKAGAPNKPAIVVTNTPRLSDFNGR